jgi:hypothetical protein
LLAFTLSVGVATAYWSSSTAQGADGSSGATTAGQGQTPTASAAGDDVTVSWSASTLANGGAMDGYLVNRYDASTLTTQTVLADCAGTVTATTCLETGVPDGEWVYTVTPVLAASWQGAESAASNAVIVGNAAPVAVADSYPLDEDTLLEVSASGVLANDTDAEDDPLSTILASGVAHGELTFNADGGFTYLPEADFSGTDSFAYKANDGTSDSNTVAVTLTVSAVNDAPVNLVPGAQQTPKNTNRVFSAANNNPISISDTDADGAIVEVTLIATNGTVTLPVLTGLTFTAGDGTTDATMTFRGTIATINLRFSGATFIPTDDFTGGASLQVVTSDLGNEGSGGTLTDMDSVMIDVNALGIFTANQDVGVPPGLTGSASYSGGTYTVAGSGEDIWNDADHFQLVSVPMTGDGRLTARVVSQVQTPSPASDPAKAGVMLRQTLAAGSIHGMMNPMQSFGSEFHWRLTTDGPSGATTVTPGIAAPYWVRITRVGDIVTGERSADGTTWVQQGSTQAITMGSTIYAGLAVSAVNTAKLNTGTFDDVALTTPPTAVADSYTVDEDTTLDVPATGVLANDSDPQSDALTAVLVSGTSGLTLNTNGSFSYTPPANFSGAASFTYQANDGVFDSNTVTVNLTVKPANEVPSFTKGADQSVQKSSGAQTVAGWATAISQGEGESGQLVDFVVTNDNSSLFTVQPTISADGTLTYTPGDVTGVATVSVRIHDNGGTANGGLDTSAIQTFTISITPDIYGPSGGSVDAADLVGTGNRYAAATTLSIELEKGTDPSGVATTGAELERATASLTSSGGTADGTCGTYGSFTPVTGGTDPTSPVADTVADQACYRYQYVVLDELGNATTYTSPDIKVDTTAPAAPSLTHSSFTNTNWSGGASTEVFYRPGAAAGAFTTTATSTDAASGIASYEYPALGASWTSTPGALGVTTYSWSGTPADPGTSNVTATNNAATASASAPFTLTADNTAPSAGTVSYADGPTTDSTVSVSFTTGTDSGSGIGTRLLQRSSATLSGSSCGTFGGFTTVTGGTNPTSPVTDAVSGGTCYQYRYVVADHVGNQDTATSTNVIEVALSYAATVSGTSGLLSYWRLGGTGSLTSVDSFTGTGGTLLTSHTGELGATWAFQAGSANTEQISNANRARRDGSGYSINYATATPPSADYSVEAELYVRTNLSGDRVGVIGRLDTASNSFYMARWEPEDTSWNLVEVTNGSVAYLNYVAGQPALVAGSTYRLRLTMTGTTLQLYVDGVLTVSATDTTLTAAGKAGIMDGEVGGSANKSNTKGIHFDSFQVTPSSYPRVVDSFGTNTGDYFGNPTLGATGAMPSDSNTAVQFDGVDDYAVVAREISTDFSIEFWFKSTQTAGATCTQWWHGMRLVDAEVSGGNDDFGTSFCGGRVIAGVGSNVQPGDLSVYSPTGYDDGSWHHVVMTRSGTTGLFELFLDGASVGSATAHTRPLTASAILSFGRSQVPDAYFAGTMDEIAVYDTVLSGPTIAAHHDAGQ